MPVFSQTSVVQYFQGYLGQPPGGFPEPLTSRMLKNAPRVKGRPGSELPPLDLAALREKLVSKHGSWISEEDVISAALYPEVFDDFARMRNEYGDLSVLPTRLFLAPLKVDEEVAVDLAKGRRVYVKLMAVTGVAKSTGKVDAFFEVNGNPLQVSVNDRSAAISVVTRKKANPDHPGEVGAPMSGVLHELRIEQGSQVMAGDPVAVMVAMKMETLVTAPASGVVSLVDVVVGDSLSAGDLICVVEPEQSHEARALMRKRTGSMLNENDSDVDGDTMDN